MTEKLGRDLRHILPGLEALCIYWGWLNYMVLLITTVIIKPQFFPYLLPNLKASKMGKMVSVSEFSMRCGVCFNFRLRLVWYLIIPSNPGFLFWVLSRKFLQSPKTESGTKNWVRGY